MRAAVLLGNGRFAVEELDVTEPGPDEVLVRIEGCGVCASSLPAWQGRPWFRYPLEAGAPGHEPWGRVLATGEAVTGIERGTRVTGLSWRAYAEFDLARAEHLVVLPERYDGRPMPGEALACAMNVFERADISRGQRVAVVGAGFIGGMLVQAATAAGAQVTAFSRRQWSLDRALEQGAAEARPMSGAADGTDCGSWPCVIECTGTQGGLDLASRLVGTRGRLVIAGYHQDGPRQVNMQLWNWRGLDVINAHERDPAIYRRGMEEAVSAVASGRIDPAPLSTHTFPLERIHDAFDTMAKRPDNFLKAIVKL